MFRDMNRKITERVVDAAYMTNLSPLMYAGREEIVRINPSNISCICLRRVPRVELIDL